MKFDFTLKTSLAIDEVVSSLEQSLKEDGFGVLWDFDLTGKLQEKGMDFNTPYRVLEVCNPKEAERVLNENKMVGYFLPCKIVVYEEDGETFVGLPRPTALIDFINNQKLSDIASDIEKRLTTSIETALFSSR
ncbi:DUF302 domain-containing protein (plasmid) [Alkalihalobacillus hwajinpoensis]|uniref:DUF302 domain-containing protein n=1 Tax=Guptibacillus hwajinpoensis TaxID=208199 RepID=UPI0018845EB5|nr:DUF302 domain-containing protein [Pseudalkalibacillus hwajinpoensis]MBF0706695.1 DUF302 domain-containing protein [Pseudalkalibacillus hwajinpoensis]